MWHTLLKILFLVANIMRKWYSADSQYKNYTVSLYIYVDIQ